MKDLSNLPSNLPVPVDDGACRHLQGAPIPSISLACTSGKKTDLSSLCGLLVIYFYPMNGHPSSPPMIGWNDIPGARGCTPQACAFRDANAELTQLGVTIFGVSSQSNDAQVEAKNRLTLPFDLLSDSQLRLSNALQLPTFQYESATYIKRITLIVKNGMIEKVFYPIFPPDQNAAQVKQWLLSQSTLRS